MGHRAGGAPVFGFAVNPFWRRFGFVVAALTWAAKPVCAQIDLESVAAAPGVRLNQIQVIGTHNSYHREPSAEALAWGQSDFVRSVAPNLAALATAYRHVPLTEQLARLGQRQLELDVYPSPDGGDFPILHHPVFDEETTVPTLRAALLEIRAWSRAHLRHVPVLIQIELKMRRPLPVLVAAIPDETLRARLAALPPPLTWDDAQLARIDALIREVFSEDEMLTPDAVRGEAPTLRDAVRTRGWPLLDAVRGRVLFALDNESEVRERYLGPGGEGRGRPLFVSVPLDHPAAAWRKLNDPLAQGAQIREAVAGGFLVRTRADAELVEARANDATRRGAALASGAQFISTDFPEEDPRYPGYVVRLPGGGVARSNPVAPAATSSR